MTTSVLSFQGRRAARQARPAEANDRLIRLRVGIAWGLVFLNVLTFYKGTWNQLPLIVPIPSKIGQLMTQGSLPTALLLAWSVNRRMRHPPERVPQPADLAVDRSAGLGGQRERHMLGAHPERDAVPDRAGSVSSSPSCGCSRRIADRRDLLLVKCQLYGRSASCWARCARPAGAPHRALAEGRLSGEFWPITPVQVADYSAVALGLVRRAVVLR